MPLSPIRFRSHCCLCQPPKKPDKPPKPTKVKGHHWEKPNKGKGGGKGKPGKGQKLPYRIVKLCGVGRTPDGKNLCFK